MTDQASVPASLDEAATTGEVLPANGSLRAHARQRRLHLAAHHRDARLVRRPRRADRHLALAAGAGARAGQRRGARLCRGCRRHRRGGLAAARGHVERPHPVAARPSPAVRDRGNDRGAHRPDVHGRGAERPAAGRRVGRHPARLGDRAQLTAALAGRPPARRAARQGRRPQRLRADDRVRPRCRHRERVHRQQLPGVPRPRLDRRDRA